MGDLSLIQQQAERIDDLLRHVQELRRRTITAEMARSGLTEPQIRVLSELAGADGLSLKELSQRVGLAHSTVSGIVDRLERHGLATRQIDPEDRRQTRILASEAVKSYLQDDLPKRRLEPVIRALRLATPEERSQVLTGLQTLVRLMTEAE